MQFLMHISQGRNERPLTVGMVQPKRLKNRSSGTILVSAVTEWYAIWQPFEWKMNNEYRMPLLLEWTLYHDTHLHVVG